MHHFLCIFHDPTFTFGSPPKTGQLQLTKLGMGFFSFETAWRTLQGYEMMNMMRKGQLQGMDKGDVRGQVTLVEVAI
jgi:hypothetical protein